LLLNGAHELPPRAGLGLIPNDNSVALLAGLTPVTSQSLAAGLQSWARSNSCSEARSEFVYHFEYKRQKIVHF
jgi:hypothetical protein